MEQKTKKSFIDVSAKGLPSLVGRRQKRMGTVSDVGATMVVVGGLGEVSSNPADCPHSIFDMSPAPLPLSPLFPTPLLGEMDGKPGKTLFQSVSKRRSADKKRAPRSGEEFLSWQLHKISPTDRAKRSYISEAPRFLCVVSSLHRFVSKFQYLCFHLPSTSE